MSAADAIQYFQSGNHPFVPVIENGLKVGRNIITMYSVSPSCASVAIGYNTLATVTNDDTPANPVNNVAIGDYSLESITTNGSDNISIGHESMVLATSSTQNVSIGSHSMDAAISSSGCVSVGYNALNSISTTSNVTAVGFNSGASLSSGTQFVGLGYNSGANISSGSSNCCIGFSALSDENSGSANTAVGTTALASQVGNFRNTACGTSAGFASIANDGCFIGYHAGILSTAADNTLIGSTSGSSITTGAGNTCVGFTSGAITTGSNNLICGINSGSNLTTGSGNIILGNNALAPTAGTSNYFGTAAAITTVNIANAGIEYGVVPAAAATMPAGTLSTTGSLYATTPYSYFAGHGAPAAAVGAGLAITKSFGSPDLVVTAGNTIVLPRGFVYEVMFQASGVSGGVSGVGAIVVASVANTIWPAGAATTQSIEAFCPGAVGQSSSATSLCVVDTTAQAVTLSFTTAGDIATVLTSVVTIKRVL